MDESGAVIGIVTEGDLLRAPRAPAAFAQRQGGSQCRYGDTQKPGSGMKSSCGRATPRKA